MSNNNLLQMRTCRRFKLWLLEGYSRKIAGPHVSETSHHQHSWWKVMCLTGVDYFSTLGYQPGIAFLAAGMLSPIATFVLVLLTLFGALPIYGRVAQESPHGEGSIAMLEHLLSRWKGKLFVLLLLGFAATDFIITITLSAADATAHILENPFVPASLHHPVGVTLVLVAILGTIFLKGFTEAIGLAVILVVVYLSLNVIVICVGLFELVNHPEALIHWKGALFQEHGSSLGMVAASLLVFPKLALGLSGFETGVAVMPLVRGSDIDNTRNPEGRILNTRKLLKTAALIMSVLLIASSVVTATLIPAKEFAKGGGANGRALAYLAHEHFGELFGTVYDISTIFILWFAGASAMAGLLNLVPRYLPRYGMAPEWARATRPLVLVFTIVAFMVTIIFDADVDAQGGAYATGVLVLMTSAAFAVTLSVWRDQWQRWGFLTIFLVFVYTTFTNMVERPEGLKIALFFIGSVILTSMISRILRSPELRVDQVELDAVAKQFVQEVGQGPIRIIANQLDAGDEEEYRLKEKEERENNHIPANDPILFFEVTVSDASEFSGVMTVKGIRIHGYRVLRAHAPAVPNGIAAFLLYLREETGKIPHAYFSWAEGNPVMYLLRYIAFGEGDTAPVTREVLRQAEPDHDRRPAIHVGG